jgi:hypothetical protein
MRVYAGLIMFLVSYWSAGYGTFLQVSALASQWLEDCANLTPTPEEENQYSANYSTPTPEENNQYSANYS